MPGGIAVAAAADLDTVERVDREAFFVAPLADEAERAIFFAAVEPERTLLATLDGEPAGTATAYSRVLGVPGGLADVAAVTWVGVRQDARGRGVLRALMAAQLDDVAAREGLAILWASEGSIYPRFGYGGAGSLLRHRLLTAESSFGPFGRQQLADFDGTLVQRPAPAAAAEMSAVVDRLAASTPGLMVRPPRHAARWTADPPSQREGAGEAQVVLALGASGEPRAFAYFAVKPGWDRGLPDGRMTVFEAVGLDLPAQAAVWDHLLRTRLVSTVTAGRRPRFDPLALLLADPRRLRSALDESVFVRVLDVPKALASRLFSAPLDLVLEVADTSRPASGGRWRVVVPGPDSPAVVTESGAEPDLVVPAWVLGAVHLGSERLATLAQSCEERTPGSLLAASRAWSWHQPLWPAEMF